MKWHEALRKVPEKVAVEETQVFKRLTMGSSTPRLSIPQHSLANDAVHEQLFPRVECRINVIT